MNRTIPFILAGAMALSLTGCGANAPTVETVPPASTETEDEENKLVIYSPNTDTEIKMVIPAFEEATGIDVTLVSMGTGECLERLEEEKEDPYADILWGGMNYGVYIEYPDLWTEYQSPNEFNLDLFFRQGKVNFFTNYSLSGSGALIINNQLAEELDVQITGYRDLLDPKLRGKIAYGDPTRSSSAWAELTNILLVMGIDKYDELAWEYVEMLIEQLDGVQMKTSADVYNSVADGKYVVGLSYEDPCIKLMEEGKDVSVVYPTEGAVWLPAAAAITYRAPHMTEAKMFIDFLLSDECQKLYAATTVRPANTSIPVTNKYMKPFSEIHIEYEDIILCAENKKEWQEQYDRMFHK